MADVTHHNLAADMTEPAALPVDAGELVVFTTRCPDKPSPNEDALCVLTSGSRSVVIVADGFGGQPAGDRAAQAAVESVTEQVTPVLAGPDDLRPAILRGFDVANERVRGFGVGAATTLVVLEIDADRVRPYHVGDSEVLVVGQRGRIRLQTISHSPVGYRVEAGLLDAEEALLHQERHIVSNMVGSEEMRIDLGPAMTLRPRDTVVVASDGLFDNLTVAEITEIARVGDPHAAVARLVAASHARMSGGDGGPSKPDDLTIALYRPRRSLRSRPRTL